jgi:outer membrane receptor for ferrienterochelin and colicin
MKSSISVVTNKTLKKTPSYRELTEAMQEWFQFFLELTRRIAGITIRGFGCRRPEAFLA